MISAKDELSHLIDCLSEGEAENILTLFQKLPDLVNSIHNIPLFEDREYPPYAPIEGGVISLLESCATIYPRRI